jgi:hypothetical protein
VHALCFESRCGVATIIPVIALTYEHNDAPSIGAAEQFDRCSSDRSTSSVDEFLNRFWSGAIDRIHFLRSHDGNKSPAIDRVGRRQRLRAKRAKYWRSILCTKGDDDSLRNDLRVAEREPPTLDPLLCGQCGSSSR